MALTTQEQQELLAETISLLTFELEFTEIPYFIRVIKEHQLKTAQKQMKIYR
ncbi:hypothetical protein [Klebsiella pneumoniae]